ncbi:Protein DDI1 [Trichinella spiralis]|uniref:Protein DDI1 n=1 Tax=Trichinella spiralis TaxID=6334 RepID=A0ABR3KEB9_TRISP
MFRYFTDVYSNHSETKGVVPHFERTIEDYGIKDADVLAVNVEPIAQSLGSDSLTSSAGPVDPAVATTLLSRMMNENPQMLQRIRSESPAVLQALQSGNIEEFRRIMQSFGVSNLSLSASDLMNSEAQRRIEDSIMQENIDHTLQHAIEHVPESFARTVEPSLQLCVGTCAVIGRIHIAQLQIGNDFFPISLMVVEEDMFDIMLGLDMLKRHQCVIDLRQNCLVIGTTGVSAPFLMEHELPAGLMEKKIELFEESMQISEEELSSSSSTQLPDEEDIAKVMEFGFSREEAIKALRIRKNVKQAVAYLVAQNVNKHFPAE